MSPITHFLVGWAVAERFGKDHRARCLISLASVAPDLDGLGVVVDLANRVLGRPESDWFGSLHHVLLHGGLGALLAVGISYGLGVRDRRTLILVAISFHLHLLCDFFGSRGPSDAEIWPIHYFAPLTLKGGLAFSHQWALNAWPNMLLTALLIGWALRQAVKSGRSPVSVFSRRWDGPVVGALRARFGPASD